LKLLNRYKNKNINKHALLMLGVGAFALIPEIAMAAPWDSTATQILAIFTGGLTRTIAIITVMATTIIFLSVGDPFYLLLQISYTNIFI
jgi:type IV secretory pathway VirB2 component (pilin)